MAGLVPAIHVSKIVSSSQRVDARDKPGHDRGEGRFDGFRFMALIGRLFVVFFGFLAACLVAGAIVVGAVLYPELSDLGAGPIDQDALNVVIGFGFIFVSGFALLPAMIVVLITEAFYIRGALTYAIGGGIVGLACYLGLIPFDTETLRFEGIVRRHLEIMTGAGIAGGVIYWLIAGRNAGAWRERRRLLPAPPPLPSHSILPPS
jgi:hypothetical protein